ncbi:SpoIIE family protein phosphatase [Streptomyces fagopyri]|uniref:protein-serine/threonine phosphatase n=1 Tax=Streptomyces fagopyri TaxID=2662397 RepID=A0A5Q0L6A5_9ACTN|nr:SpoIIE family protein phosphatase [Streptomyces fagopyri]QFZ72246.1 SpoIIE family protein phosphatase [Streptomyces fagopyri]
MARARDTMPHAGQEAGHTVDTATAVVDAHGVVVAWGREAERLSGFPAAEAIGLFAGRLLVDPEVVLRAPAFTDRRRWADGWTGIVGLHRRDGTPLDVYLRVSPLTERDGGVRWLVTATEMTAVPSWPMNGAGVRALLTGAPIGIAVRDTDLRCTWVNDALALQDGIPREKRLGRRLTEVLPGPEAESVEAVMRLVLQSGKPQVDHEYRAWMPAKPQQEHAFSTSFFRLDDADGRTLGICAMSVDVTDRQRARERLAVLSEASTRIGTTLEVMRTGQELADLAVARIADYVTVDLAESVTQGEDSLARLGSTNGHVPAFRRAGVASIREGVPESLWSRGETVPVPAPSPFTEVLASGESHLEPVLDTSRGTWLDRDHERLDKIRRYGMHSLMIVPIHARGAVLGVAVFVRVGDSLPFEADDLRLAEELVARAALSLENARRYVRERAAALVLQRNLLPGRLIGGVAVDVASHYVPADTQHGVGGDWFDVIPLSGARVALVVGDVVGHGINAAATMGRLRAAVHTLANMDLCPDELLAHLDDTISRLDVEDGGIPERAAAESGATCLYAVYDPATRRCTMARAGHPPPVVISPEGQVSIPDLPAGLPLGVGQASFEAVEVELPEGCVVAFYTDGLVETRDQDIDAGISRLGAVLARPDRPLDELCTAAFDTLAARALEDDATLLLARPHALMPSQIATWDLPNDPVVVAHARNLATTQLTGWGLEALTATTELIVSELVTNAVRHGAGPITLRLIRHEVLVCEVTDTSDSVPRLRHARPTDEGGRGLFLVGQMSSRRGTRHSPTGKTVWAEQEINVPLP